MTLYESNVNMHNLKKGKKHDQSRFSSGTASSIQKINEQKNKNTKNHWKNRKILDQSVQPLLLLLLFFFAAKLSIETLQ